MCNCRRPLPSTPPAARFCLQVTLHVRPQPASACRSHFTCAPTRLQVTLHAHTAREEGHVSALICTLNPKTGEVAKAKPRWVAWGLKPKGFVWLEWV